MLFIWGQIIIHRNLQWLICSSSDWLPFLSNTVRSISDYIAPRTFFALDHSQLLHLWLVCAARGAIWIYIYSNCVHCWRFYIKDMDTIQYCVLRCEENAIVNEIQRTETQLRNYESSRTDKLSRYGGWMPTAIKKIDEAFNKGRFVKKPIGPIGTCKCLSVA